MSTLDLDAINCAVDRVSRFALQTPVIHAASLSSMTGLDVFLKLENLQPTGSFKVRGAANALVAPHAGRDSPAGVVTYSTGNHGRAVAHVGGSLGVPVTVCVGGSVPEAKLRLLRESGATVRIEGTSQDDAAVMATQLTAEHGLTLIEPFDDPRIILGQATIGLEIVDQLPDVDLVMVPVSGGGLIGGIALAIKSLRPDTRVVGVCAQRAPAMFDSVRAGRPVASDEESTLADSLRGGLGADNRWTFDLVRRYVDDLVTVSDAQIADALAYGLKQQGLVIEGAAAVGIAALLHATVQLRSARTAAVVVSGRNIGLDELLAAAASGTSVGIC